MTTATSTTATASAKRPSRFTEATREQSKLKAALIGPPNGGKSFTALRLATLMQAAGLCSKIAVIETEAGKIKKYVGQSPDGIPFKFSLCVLNSYSPLEYVAAIEDAYNGGCDCIIIDSMSHAWQGKDGVLETVDAVGGNSKFTSGWKVGSPMQTKFVESVLQCPAHVIATMRTKVEYVLEKQQNRRGEMVDVPKRIGMAPIQRDGIEYEFEIVGSFDVSHVMTITKSICEPLDGAVFVKPGPDFANPIIEWLQTGEVASAPKIMLGTLADAEQVRRIMEAVAASRRNVDDEKAELLKRYGVREFHQLSYDQADVVIRGLEARVRNARPADKNGQQQQQVATAAPAAPGQATQPAANIPTANAKPAAAQSAPVPGLAASLNQPLTDPQVESLKTLYKDWAERQFAVLTQAQGKTEEEALPQIKTWWANVLSGYRGVDGQLVTSAKKLTIGEADRLIRQLTHWEECDTMQDMALSRKPGDPPANTAPVIEESTHAKDRAPAKEAKELPAAKDKRKS